MQLKIIIGLLCVVGVAIFFFVRQPSFQENAEKAQTTPTVSQEDMAQQDPNAPGSAVSQAIANIKEESKNTGLDKEFQPNTEGKGIVLFDIKLMPKEDETNEAAAVNTLLTGDLVFIGRESETKPGFIEVKNDDGYVGWVEAKNIVAVPGFPDFQNYANSSSPIEQFLTDTQFVRSDLIATEEQYKIFMGKEFEERLKNNGSSDARTVINHIRSELRGEKAPDIQAPPQSPPAPDTKMDN